MNVQVKQIDEKDKECVIIECVEVTKEVDSIRAFAMTTGANLTGHVDNHIVQFKLSDVYYFEALDEKVFAYTEDDSYELKMRLYELENAYEDNHFIRCSKSFIINLMLLDSISPALNGRFTAHMRNNEKIMMSFFVAVTFISVVMALVGMVYDPHAQFGYDAFLSPVLFGIVASVPSIVKYSRYELTARQTFVRNVIHFLLIEGFTLAVLYYGGLITTFPMALSLFSSILIVYVTVSLVLWVNDKKTANDVNRALVQFQSKGQL